MNIPNFDKYIIDENYKVYSKRTNKPVKIIVGRGGYYTLRLYDNNNKQKSLFLHRIIATIFLPNPDDYPIIDHVDRNRLNNKLNNLRWCSYSTNSSNQAIRTNNKTGHKLISYDKKRNRYVYHNTPLNIHKRFKTKIDALCYKFIIKLKN